MLKVSHPFLVQFLERGEIAFQQDRYASPLRPRRPWLTRSLTATQARVVAFHL